MLSHLKISLFPLDFRKYYCMQGFLVFVSPLFVSFFVYMERFCILCNKFFLFLEIGKIIFFLKETGSTKINQK